MLSYRHAFHAGNHADVLKHWLLALCLEYLTRKPKPLLYLDTHAGAGLYALSDPQATRTGEYETGIGRLWQGDTPSVFDAYLNAVSHYNYREPGLSLYPGSPAIAANLLRADDRLWLVEQHDRDRQLLQSALGGDPRLQVLDGDGFRQVRALMPPPSRRGLVLIDPPYELKQDYALAVAAVADGLRRFATGSYLVWYPLLNAAPSQQLPDRLLALAAPRWLHVTLTIRAMPAGHGMYGSGVFVVNPPYPLHEQLQQGLPWLAQRLAMDDSADYHLDCSR